ncbi:MAG TPA: AEC family transporter [Dictyoglomaceae bacterium]|nr:AEC family transporter [Dictyoglomaceae bacterium]
MIKTLITLIIISFLGFLSKKFQIFKQKDTEIFSRFVYNFSLPALVFFSIYSNPPQGAFLKVAMVEWITSFIVGAISIIIGVLLKLKRETIASLFLVTIGGNVTFLGYPIMERLYGSEGLSLAIIYDQLGMIIFVYTIGILVINLFTSQKELGFENSLKKILLNPPLWGLIAGLVLQPIKIPDFLLESFSLLGRATTPLMMFLLGLSLEKPESKETYLPVSIGVILKLLAFPLFALLLSNLFNLSGVPFNVTILESAMPSMLTALVLAIQFKLDYPFSSHVITYSTLLSLITLNLWMEVIK